MDPSIRKIEAFVAASRAGSITAAARELGLAQSTVSRAVSSLEEEWGVRLFDRRGPELRATPDGRCLLADAQAVCDAFGQLERHVGAVRDLDDGILGIAAPTSIVAMRLPGPLGRFVADHPHVEINISECTYGEAERQLLDGAVELAFIPAAPDEGEFVSALYDKDELVVVAPRGHFSPGAEAVPIESLLDERFIADTETAPLLQRELTDLRIHCETSDITAILAMVEAGLGVSLLPSLALERTGFDVDVRRLEQPAYRVLYLVRRREADLSVAARAFLSYLR